MLGIFDLFYFVGFFSEQVFLLYGRKQKIKKTTIEQNTEFSSAGMLPKACILCISLKS